jgi:hypothetical protein
MRMQNTKIKNRTEHPNNWNNIRFSNSFVRGKKQKRSK